MARSSRPKGSGSRQGDRPTPTPSTPPANAELEAEIERAIGSVVGQSQRGQVARRVVSLIRSEAFSGPLPPPQHLAEYEKICPGLADRIMKMAEVGQIRNEDRIDHVIDREYDDRRVGMYFGFAALALLVVCGTILYASGHEVAGGSLLGVAVLGTIVSSFIRGRGELPWPRRKSDEEKKQTDKT